MSSKSKVKPSRSPAPLRTPTTPSQFFPPSYFAAAAGVPYPKSPNRDESNQQDQFDQDVYPLSSRLVAECSPHSSNPGRTRRKSQLGDLEPQLLPTLSDTVERMTRPPSTQVVSVPPFRSVAAPSYSSGVARTPSTSSQGSSVYSVISEANSSASAVVQSPTIRLTSGSLRQAALRSPLNAYPEQPPSITWSSSRPPNPKSILKAHTIPDRHLQIRQPHMDSSRLPIDQARKASRSPIPIPPGQSLSSESKTEHARQMPASPRPKIDGSHRTSRARSRTDPGTLPKGLPLVYGRQPNPQPSGIPRRVGISPIPATPVAVYSDAPSINSAQHEKRRLFVTNAEISSSSSSESQAPLTHFIRPKMSTRTDSRSSAESQLRPPRFGLGLGLSGMSEPKNAVQLPPGQRWTTKTSDELYLRHTNSPGNKRHQRDGTPKKSDRPPSRNPRIDIADGRRRQRELLALVHTDLNDSSGCDSRPSSSERSDGSGDSLRSTYDDSGSEYSPVEEEDHTTRRSSMRWVTKPEPAPTKASTRQSPANLPADETHVDEQYTPRALSSYYRQNIHRTQGLEDGEFLQTTVVSDEDASPIDETITQAVHNRYSSELSRMMAVSMAAAAHQRRAFGISASPDLENHQADHSELPHADSDTLLIEDDRWQDDCDELATGSLLQQLNQVCNTGGNRGYDDRRSSTDELSLSSAQTQSSMSQESIYSASNSPTRRSSRDILTSEPLPAIPPVRDQQWQTLERHVLDVYGEAEARRQQLIWDFTESEVGFVMQLQNMLELFILPLRVRDTRMWVSGIPSDVMKLFDWLDDIVRVHAHLSATLTSRQIVDHPRLQFVSEVFRGFVPRLETYQPYLVKLEFTASVIDDLIHEGKSDFGDFIKLQEASECCQGWSLEKYLIEPVNRLAQYPEVFRRLLQLTPKSHPDYMSTLSLFHVAKLTIRVLSEVKDREDAYELVKVACSGIKGISPLHLAHRERRLLLRGSLTCVQVSNDEPMFAPEPLADTQPVPRSDAVPGQRTRRADKLSKAINTWRGRSNSIKSTASTVVSFRTAPSSFDVQMQTGQPPVLATPVVRVESEPVDVEVLVFSDIVLLASKLDVGADAGEVEMEPMVGFGLSRIVSVLDEIDRRACITLDLAPMTPRALEEGYAQSTGTVVTVSLSIPHTHASVTLADWLVPLRRCCQYTHRTLSSLGTTHALVDRAASTAVAQKPMLSLVAAGLPLPKSPSMQIEDTERGVASDAERQEREERGWWSKRFHEVFAELSAQDGVLS